MSTEARASAQRSKGLLTVGEAADVLGVSEFRARRLIADGKLRSERVGRRRLVPTAAVSEYHKARRAHEARLRAAAPVDWDWEGNLVATLAAWFKKHGWREVSRSDAAIREHGIDLVLEKDGRTRVVEVKGWPAREHSRGLKIGAKKQWRATMGRSYFGDLVLSAMILRSARPDDEVAIAVPARDTFLKLLRKVHPSLVTLGIGSYVITEAGEVNEGLRVEDVDHGRLARDRAADRAVIRRLLKMSDREREAHFVSSNRASVQMFVDAAHSK
ncbi:MAG: excisionase family DNA-binding protein [Chloroflexota bacterium]|nr:excisionase family DNA-binding protein [Chloroflexota bacterium]